jgi:hypothetical protein
MDERKTESLYLSAKTLVMETGKASTSNLQRHLKIGYARAARLMDMLEERGIVGPPDGVKPRDVIQKKKSEVPDHSEEEDEDEESEPETEKRPIQRTNGRPPLYEKEEDFRAMVWEYIDYCRESYEMPNKAGMRFYLRMSSDTWNEYRKRFPEAHKEAEDYLENKWVQRLAGTTPTGAIFYLKNAFKEDYKDRHENDNTHRFDKLEIDDIRALLSVLPKEEQDKYYELIAKLTATAASTGGRGQGQEHSPDRPGDNTR